MDITTWSIYMDISMWSISKSDYVLCSQRWRSSVQSLKIRPGTDCGSDFELLIAKFGLKLNKVGKTTRPFRYDLNPLQLFSGSDKFKRLNLVDRVPEELWTVIHNIVQEIVTKTISKRKKCKKAN